MSIVRKPTPKHKGIVKEVRLGEFPSVVDLFRWDILQDQFATLLSENIGVMKTIIEYKSPPCEVVLDATQFKAEDREQNE